MMTTPRIRTQDIPHDVLERFTKDYKSFTNADLSARFGFTLRQIERIAHELKLKKTDRSASQAAAAAKRAGLTPEQAREREEYIVAQFAERSAGAIARELGMPLKAVEGVIHRHGVRKGGLSTPRQPEYRAPGWAGGNSANDRHARLTAEQRAKLPPVGMDKAKRTVAPAFVDTRFTVAPGESTYGAGFAAMGPGRYCEDGRTWGGRA